jgi:deoxyribonuclease V
MSPSLSHGWDLSPRAAIALQKQLAQQVTREVSCETVETVAGIDMSIRDDMGRAAVVVFSYPELEIINHSIATRKITSPYVPGLLSFREGPVVLDALENLATQPDLLVFDAQGIAHPRRLGLASHIGVLVDLPAIGCAKSRLCGQYEEPGPERGNYTFLTDHGETIGAVVRTRTNVKPVFVSVGHRIDLSTSIAYILNTGRGYRLPEPTRWAHQVAGGKIPPKR